MNRTETNNRTYDLAVAGGGLAGLTAALMAARAGKTVVVLEQAQRLGGRARTTVRDGIHFNLGPHALYRQGAAAKLFQKLGIEYDAGVPDIRGIRLRKDDRLFPLPLGFFDLLRVKRMSPAAKFELAGVMKKLESAQIDEWRGRWVGEWLRANIKHGSVADLLRILFCLTTYAGQVDELDMGLLLAQWRVGAGGVAYLDGGWASLVAAVRAALAEEGVSIVTGKALRALSFEGEDQILRYGAGESLRAAAVVLALDPAAVHQILGEHSPLGDFLSDLRPVRAAVLDVGLRAVAGGPPLGVLDIDRRLYGLCHTPTARLAPAGFQVVHAAKYLRDDEKGADFRRELEDLLDVARPGWREHLVADRFLPNITVAHALRSAGFRAPGPRLLKDRPVYACGDWVGEQGMLLDASLASVRAAIKDYLKRRPARCEAV